MLSKLTDISSYNKNEGRKLVNSNKLSVKKTHTNYLDRIDRKWKSILNEPGPLVFSHEKNERDQRYLQKHLMITADNEPQSGQESLQIKQEFKDFRESDGKQSQAMEDESRHIEELKEIDSDSVDRTWRSFHNKLVLNS